MKKESILKRFLFFFSPFCSIRVIFAILIRIYIGEYTLGGERCRIFSNFLDK